MTAMPRLSTRTARRYRPPVADSAFFSRALAGLLGDDFLERALGTEVVLADMGPIVESLLTWADLNEILATRPLLAPRLRLYHQGSQIPVKSYARVEGTGTGRREVVKPELLSGVLRAGATLIIDNIDALHPPVGVATEDLILWVGEQARANLYLTWGSSGGFNAHWDTHDTFIVQLVGSKHWAVYGQGRHFPMERDVAPNLECPQAVVWEDDLRQGQVLHVPRGWWHAVRGAGEMSAHLTFGFTRRTGISWAEWLTDQLRHHEVFRRDLPRFASREQLAAQGEALRACLEEEVSRNPPSEYLAQHEDLLPRRLRFSLPLPVAFTTPADRAEVELMAILPRFRDDGDQVTLWTDGTKYTLSPTVAALVHVLRAQGRVRCDELRSASELDRAPFAIALAFLVEQHLVAITTSVNAQE